MGYCLGGDGALARYGNAAVSSSRSSRPKSSASEMYDDALQLPVERSEFATGQLGYAHALPCDELAARRDDDDVLRVEPMLEEDPMEMAGDFGDTDGEVSKYISLIVCYILWKSGDDSGEFWLFMLTGCTGVYSAMRQRKGQLRRL